MGKRAVCYCSVFAAFLAIPLLAMPDSKVCREARHRVSELIRHIKGPWNPFAKKVGCGSPFSAVRWKGSVAEVEVGNAWYELISLDDIPAHTLVDFCKERYHRIWRKRFEEDLGIVLVEMGKPGHAEGETGPLTVRELATGKTIVLKNVTWSFANRMAVLGKALEVWKANGRRMDPRDDPSVP
jgi:hypothetical protein